MVRASGEMNARAMRGASGEASASHQETSVQNPNPSHNPFSYPSLLQQLLERTLFSARPASTGAAPAPEDISGGDATRDDAPAADDTGIGVDTDDDTGARADAAGLLELAELL